MLEKIINKHGLKPSQLRSEDSIDDEEYKPNDEGFIDINEGCPELSADGIFIWNYGNRQDDLCDRVSWKKAIPLYLFIGYEDFRNYGAGAGTIRNTDDFGDR